LPTPAPALTAIQHSLCCNACLADTCTGTDSNSTLTVLQRLPCRHLHMGTDSNSTLKCAVTPALMTPAPALTAIQHSVCCDACLADTCTGIDSNSTLSVL